MQDEAGEQQGQYAAMAVPAARVLVVGAGPAGLMAAERAARAGARVQVLDAMPSAGRKFLLAGRGGLNLTHAEHPARFRTRYGSAASWLGPALDDFDAEALRAWADGLGIATFVGTSGRVFPRGSKTSPLLRAWLARLRDLGVTFLFRHRLLGLEGTTLRVATPEGERAMVADAVVLALGGGSWPRLGSDRGWTQWLPGLGVPVAPLVASNCGFERPWSPHLRSQFAGAAVKNVRAWVGAAAALAPHTSPVPADSAGVRGEFVLSDYGVEGGLIYALSAALRAQLRDAGTATLWLDLVPDLAPARVYAALAAPRRGRSLASVLTRALGLDPVKRVLLHECVDKAVLADPRALAAALSALPVVLHATRPLAEAISSAGGVCEGAFTDGLMLHALPGVFAAGEMLDWDAPTGGYLLTASMATGVLAGEAAARYACGFQRAARNHADG